MYLSFKKPLNNLKTNVFPARNLLFRKEYPRQIWEQNYWKCSSICSFSSQLIPGQLKLMLPTAHSGGVWWLMVCCSLPVQWQCLENSGSFWPTESSQQDWREPRPNPAISQPTVRNQDWCTVFLPHSSPLSYSSQTHRPEGEESPDRIPKNPSTGQEHLEDFWRQKVKCNCSFITVMT